MSEQVTDTAGEAQEVLTFQRAMTNVVSHFAGIQVPAAMVFDHLTAEPGSFILEALCDQRGNHCPSMHWLDADGVVQVAETAAALANSDRVAITLESVQVRIEDDMVSRLEEIRQRDYPFFTMEYFLAHIVETFAQQYAEGILDEGDIPQPLGDAQEQAPCDGAGA